MGLPQRDGRPALDLSPDATPDNASWAEQYVTGNNDLNFPVPVHKGKFPTHGWGVEPYEALGGGPAGGKGGNNTKE